MKPTPDVIVYQAPFVWDALWNRAQPISYAVSELGIEVIYLEPGMRPASTGIARQLRKIPKVPGRIPKGLQWPVLQKISERISVVSWETVGWSDTEYTRTHDRSWLSYQLLHSVLSRSLQKGKSAWVLTSRPSAARLLNFHAWDRIIVDIEDPWFSMRWSTPHSRKCAMRWFLRADKIIANGPSLAEEYSQFAQRPIYSLPNGIDEKFIEETAREVQIRNHSGKTPPWKCVFTGSIDDRLDAEMLLTIINGTPEWEFVFVGPVRTPFSETADWEKLSNHPRFKHIREVSREQLPAILAQADALILPYFASFSRSMFPAKLFEYLCTARPVLSTVDFSKGMIETVIECQNTDQFVKELRKIQVNNGEAAYSLEHCIQIARNNTWHHRALELIEH